MPITPGIYTIHELTPCTSTPTTGVTAITDTGVFTIPATPPGITGGTLVNTGRDSFSFRNLQTRCF